MLNESILSFSKIWSLYFSCFYSFPNKLGKDEKWKYEKTQRISGCSLALAHMKLLSLQGKIPSQEKKNVKSILKFFLQCLKVIVFVYMKILSRFLVIVMTQDKSIFFFPQMETFISIHDLQVLRIVVEWNFP